MISLLRPSQLAFHSSFCDRLGTRCIIFLFVSYLAAVVECMTDGRLASLRRETIDVFYHGFDNYMKHAFPDDELKPFSCKPLSRDRENPAHIELNDSLGNYSLTLVDSLSTLAILASSPDVPRLRRDPLTDFQDGIVSLVNLYGDGTNGTSGQGSRGKGFDLDSKVQVFETVIRGVGGLLSAHLFAVGDLPIHSRTEKPKTRAGQSKLQRPIKWRRGFTYDGQLLRLATDLAIRLLPAFYTETGLPYPRVNLRHGIPFYPNSPLNADAESGKCDANEVPLEITETCSAGAGSLVLEFSTLSRLTGDSRFEELAKRAFWAVWERRSVIGLVGAGIDAESGQWVNSYTGVGAGIDSFFEYAFKSHILLSGTEPSRPAILSDLDIDFLSVWEDAHTAIKQHVYRGSEYQHPHYIQSDVNTGAMRAFWIDSLSAYYPGLLVLAGELEEAIETHLLYAALWTRYAALPERWSVASGTIEAGLRWWGGRPEFIESTWYLYRATLDPWYLHVGEMVLHDIQNRCWTECGWAGLEDVRSGELKDRMESFFLGETVKYLYLLFDPSHPLNQMDDPFVFTTEGHPLIIPRPIPAVKKPKKKRRPVVNDVKVPAPPKCPAAPILPPLSVSAVAQRADFFHAATLARLNELPRPEIAPDATAESSYDAVSFLDAVAKSPNNFTWYPWTLPMQYIPAYGQSSKLDQSVTFDLSFPTIPNSPIGPLSLQRVADGILVASVSGLKFGMIRESAFVDDVGPMEVFRVHTVAHLPLGKHEKVWISLETISGLNPTDPYFTRHREVSVLDLVVDLTPETDKPEYSDQLFSQAMQMSMDSGVMNSQLNVGADSAPGSLFNALVQHFSSLLEQRSHPLAALLPRKTQLAEPTPAPRPTYEATSSTGKGAGPLPDVADTSSLEADKLVWNSIHVTDENCARQLPSEVPRDFQVIVMKRGGCSFAEKLKNIPAFAPSPTSLQLVVVVSYQERSDTKGAIRPLLDEAQMTPSGMPRFNAIPMVMVEGGKEVYETLRRATGIGLRRRYRIESQGLRINNLIVT